MKKRTLKQCVMMIAICFSFLLFGFQVKAESQIGNSSTMSSAPQLTIGETYWIVTNGLGYVSFVTPSQPGYVQVEYKNITIDAWAYGIVMDVSGEKLAESDRRPNGTATFKFRSDSDKTVGNSAGAVMSPNTKYYIRVGYKEKSGNVKLTVRFRADSNRDKKEYAEPINMNKEYTRSIDGIIGNDNDDDYFSFVAASSGAHHFSINNATGGRLYYCIRKWTSDEYIKRTNNSDMNSDISNNSKGEYDIVLEAGQKYYLDVWGGSVGNYSFKISNESVKSISMTSSKTMSPGETFTLNPTVSPSGAYNKKLKYSSSDSNVAYVNSSTGEIKAYRAGIAVITATATDGSGTKATCTIYVTPSKPSRPYWSKSSNTSIRVSWSSMSGVSGYTLYRSSGSKWVAVKNTKSTSCTVSKLKAGTGYKFRVKAYLNVNGKKLYSAYSDSIALATTPKKNSIKSIRKLKAKKYSYGYTYRAKVTWKKSSGANKYKLYYKAAGSSYKRLLGTYRGTSTTVSLTWYKYSRGTKKYTFYVVPVKNYGGRDYIGSYSKGKTYKFK